MNILFWPLKARTNSRKSPSSNRTLVAPKLQYAVILNYFGYLIIAVQPELEERGDAAALRGGSPNLSSSYTYSLWIDSEDIRMTNTLEFAISLLIVQQKFSAVSSAYR